MSAIFKPMLACEADLAKLRFPLLASAKLDGVRAIVRDGVVYSRSNKPIPNKWVQENLGHLEHYDGELIVGDPCSKTVYRDTVSQVMSADKTDGCCFYAFDHIQHPGYSYMSRSKFIAKPSHVVKLDQHLVTNLDTLLALEETYLTAGYEGLILRNIDAPYKHGRSTVKEGYLLKLKRFVDAEYEVIGFEERQHNGNEATTNELGRTKRSSHAAGKTGRGDLGALICQGDGFTFNVGTGFTDAERDALWKIRDSLPSRIAKVKSFLIGVKTAPRFPVFLGFRDARDMS